MAVQFLWNDTDISDRVQWDTININAVLTKERGTATFTILTPVTSEDPLSGLPEQMDVIEIIDTSGIFFGGNITEIENTISGQEGGFVVSSVITVTDYGFLLDSKLVKTSFANADPHDIIAALIAQYASVNLPIISGSIDNTNVNFVFSEEPYAIIPNGDFTHTLEGDGWTWNAGTMTATLANPVGSGNTLQAIKAGNFTYNNVQKGNFLVATISFNYEQLTDCIQALATQIGWDWYVDPDQDIHFFFATTADGSSEYNPAPFNITDDEINPDTEEGYLDWASLDIDQNITNLKNQVYVIGGTYAKEFINDPQPNSNPPEYPPVDNYTTVSGQLVYPLAFHYQSDTLEVTLDGVTKSVGIYNQNTPADYDVMYNDAGPLLIFNSDPGSGHTLLIQGIAEVPIVAIVNDPDSIAEFVNEETGFDGIFEDSIIDPSISSVQEAQERGIADITLFGHPVYDVKFNTRVPGLRIGQIIQLDSAIFGFDEPYPLVIRTITATSHTSGKLIYAIEAIGSQVVTFTDTMLLLLQQQNAATPVAASTVVQIITVSPTETIDVDDDPSMLLTVTPTARTGDFQWGSTAGNAGTWGFAAWG